MSLASMLPVWDCPPGYLAGWAGLVLFWGFENFFVQALLFDAPPITSRPRWYQTARLGINLTVAAMLLLVFGRTALVLVACLNFALSLVVVAHGHYFHRACSLCQGIKHFREGLQSWSFAFQLIPAAAWISLLCGLAIKLYWIWLITPAPPQFQANGLVVGFLLALLVAQLVGLQFTSFRFNSIRLTSITRAVYAYGYLNSWIAEFFIAPDTRQVVEELGELHRISPDRLAGREAPWPVEGHVVIVQLESIGWNVPGLKVNGVEVCPFLSSLVRESRLFKLLAYHSIGTADMDYAALSGGTPSPNLISYFVPDIDYSDALPRFMRDQGFRTTALHGATGEFYSRRGNFERMGFDEIRFREEFRGTNARQSYWGVRDQELFRISSTKLRSARNREFHFIITLDSHGPFNLITEDEKEIFPRSRVWQENYFNSVRVLDNNLREYIESLPAGTLLVLYGDHTAAVQYSDFRPAREGDAEYVPCLVHVCGALAEWRDEGRGLDPLPDDLRILDVLNFLRRRVTEQRAVPKAAAVA